MIRRFSLYGDFNLWKDNIKEDPAGKWAHWDDVAPYIQYAEQHGISFEQPVVQPIMKTDEDFLLDELDQVELEEDEFMDDDDGDVFEYMTRRI